MNLDTNEVFRTLEANYKKFVLLILDFYSVIVMGSLFLGDDLNPDYDWRRTRLISNLMRRRINTEGIIDINRLGQGDATNYFQFKK